MSKASWAQGFFLAAGIQRVKVKQIATSSLTMRGTRQMLRFRGHRHDERVLMSVKLWLTLHRHAVVAA